MCEFLFLLACLGRMLVLFPSLKESDCICIFRKKTKGNKAAKARSDLYDGPCCYSNLEEVI